MTKYWIGVAHRGHVLIAQENGFCAFSHGKEAAVHKLAKGDQFAYYSPRDTFGGAPVQAFTALGEVTGDAPVFAAFPVMGRDAWMRAAAYETVREVPVRPMLDHLTFVHSTHNWGMAFRQSMFEVSATDFATIATAMRAK